MPSVTPDPRHIRAFASAQAFERWLAANHAKQSEIYLRIYKRGSEVQSVSHAEALDVALCWGWIDGIRKRHDAESFLQRFCPRKPKSTWSQINREHVARLTAAGRMTEHGLREVAAAQADGRWQAAYAGSAKLSVPDDLRSAIEAEPKALATFRKLNRQNLYSLVFRTNKLKTAAGRARRIASFVAMLKRGEAPYPQRDAK